MKTILISILSGVEAKAVLRTDLLSVLLASTDIEVVLLVRNPERKAFYEKEFSHPRVRYAVVAGSALSFSERFFELLKYFLVRTPTMSLHRRLRFLSHRNIFVYVGAEVASFLLARPLFQRLARVCDACLVPAALYSHLYEQYRPALVFLANLFDPVEIALLCEARRRGVQSVGFINSWDKVGAKGFIRLLPDALMVPNEIVKGEAIRYDAVPAGMIFVSGVPQYDIYWNNDGLLSREEFFSRIRADSQKHLIVFGPMGKTLSDSDWDMIDLLHTLIRAHVPNAELLVRFQPNDFVGDEAEFARRSWLRAEVPGIRFGSDRGVDWDMTRGELMHLKNTLYHASLIVCYASSLVIDAAVFDKPIINIGFEVRTGDPAEKQPTRRYLTMHYTRALATGGISMARSREDLLAQIQRYFADSSLDAVGRARLVREQCVLMDGKTGVRMARFLLSRIAL